MEIDPENPVVRLCSNGIRAEMAGDVEGALRCYTEAWNARRDSYEACIAAHYVARLQHTPEGVLNWNQKSLNSANAANDERVQAFYPSLYLNLGKAYEDLARTVEARRYYLLAARHLNALQDGSYADVVRHGISEGLKRVSEKREGGKGRSVSMSLIRTVALLLCSFLATLGMARAAQEEYPLGPDSQRQARVPQGSVAHYTWTSPGIWGMYPGTVRDYWVYVPTQYTPDKPACVMVFQDGATFIKEDGRARIPIVFDNLIAKREMPVTIGIFINPGVLKAPSTDQQDRFNRSFEYDGLGDRYARFLLDEIIPEVSKQYNLSTNPDDRAIAGLSSGGICAFTAAWNRPDAFHRVLSFIGSFTDLRGGDIYPALIRKIEPKPFRVFLQDGSHDLNIYAGDWWMANQTMSSALEYAGYDVKFVTGDKDHDMDQGGAILPDALRWLWRDYPQPIAKPAPNHRGDKRTALLDPGHEWELVTDWSPPPVTNRNGVPAVTGTGRPQLTLATGIGVDAQGNVFFTNSPADRIDEVEATGKIVRFQEHAEGARGLAFDGDGSLYVCEGKSRSIVAYANHSKRVVLADVDCQDLTITKDGGIYFTEPAEPRRRGRVWYFHPSGTKIDVTPDAGISPNGVSLSPDQSLVYITDPATRWVRSLQAPEGRGLTYGEPFYRLETPDESSLSGAAGMTVDSLGYVYVTTNMGVQVCDQPGRVVAILTPPTLDPLSGITFGSPDLQDLYVIAGDRLFKHRMLRKGTLPWVPQKPPVPQL
jgi:sugar lactone lactonase YvrE/enterochelin esterase-like enzyme